MRKNSISVVVNQKVNFPYCKLHVLYAFQPKGSKEEIIDKEDGVPEFIEKKN